MQTITCFRKKGYRKQPTIPQMIKSLEEQKIYDRMRLVQQTEFCRIKNIISEGRTLCPEFVKYLKILYWNFVSNKFEFKNKSNKSIVVKQQPTHIGMRVFLSMS